MATERDCGCSCGLLSIAHGSHLEIYPHIPIQHSSQTSIAIRFRNNNIVFADPAHLLS